VHSAKYASNEYDIETNKPVNTCMSKDNLRDVEEEIVDAVFNMLVYLKRDIKNRRSSIDLLASLLLAWEFLQLER